ncbi:MAG: peptidoglycan-binding protein [Firmicutes bacterium]|nr:peptidoglycan-binding protein [Bacillota bacterium]
MLDEFIHYLELEAANHSIYVWGAQGQRGREITEKWIRKCENSDKNADRAVNYWKKQCLLGYGDKLAAFDCSGLGVYWLLKHGLISGDKTANGLRGLTSTVARAEVTRGDWLFEVNNNRATHIGYAISPVHAVECRGRDWGVCITRIDKRNWNAFGRPKIFKEEILSGAYSAGELCVGDSGPEVKALQQKLAEKGFSLPEYGADGSYGAETAAAVTALQIKLGVCPTGIAGQAEEEALGLAQSGGITVPGQDAALRRVEGDKGSAANAGRAENAEAAERALMLLEEAAALLRGCTGA